MPISMDLYLEIPLPVVGGYGALYGNLWIAQTFTPSDSITFDGVEIYIENYGSTPSGDLVVGLYATDGTGKPTGTAIATKNVAAASVNYSDWTEFDLTDQSLVSDTKYAIVISSPDSGGLAPYKYKASTTSYADGKGWTSTNGGSSWTDYGADFPLRVYGEAAAPSKPINPTPENSASDLTLDETTATWENGGGATSYNVYFGLISGDLTLISEGQTELEAVLSTNFFTYGDHYYWRVDAVNDVGVTQGDEWDFTTISFGPPLPSGVTLVDGEPTGTPTGANNIMTTRRLVAIAADKVWYEDI